MTQELNAFEQYRILEHLSHDRKNFSARVNPLHLEYVLAKNKEDPMRLRQLIMSERTPENFLYHLLWVLSGPTEIQQNPSFVDYYEFCLQETKRLHIDDTEAYEGYSLTIFTERFTEEFEAHEKLLIKLSGAREFPSDNPAERVIYLHLAYDEGILVYELPYETPAMMQEQLQQDRDENFPNAEPFHYVPASIDKQFVLREAKAVRFFAHPIGWEGLEGLQEGL